MKLLRLWFLPFLASLSSACYRPGVAEFDTIGTRTGSTGVRPTTAAVSLAVCDHPALQVGASCRVPVRMVHARGPRASSANSFVEDGGPFPCVVDEEAVTVTRAWGAIDRGGGLCADLSVRDETGKLAIFSLHGRAVSERPLTDDCHSASPEPVAERAAREP